MHPMHGVRKELSQRRIMTTSSLPMIVNWDNVIGHCSENFFITRKKVVLIEYFHSCYTKTRCNAQKN